MKNIIIIAILVVILGFAVGYVIKSKKNGKKCIGCPQACSCDSKNDNCSCCSNKN